MRDDILPGAGHDDELMPRQARAASILRDFQPSIYTRNARGEAIQVADNVTESAPLAKMIPASARASA